MTKFCDFICGSFLWRVLNSGLMDVDLVVVESRDITYLIFQVILKDLVIKRLYKFMEGSSLLHIPNLPSLVAKGIVVLDT